MLKREVPYFNAKKSVKLAELPPTGEKFRQLVLVDGSNLLGNPAAAGLIHQ
jgi:hypothetical protein